MGYIINKSVGYFQQGGCLYKPTSGKMFFANVYICGGFWQIQSQLYVHCIIVMYDLLSGVSAMKLVEKHAQRWLYAMINVIM